MFSRRLVSFGAALALMAGVTACSAANEDSTAEPGLTGEIGTVDEEDVTQLIAPDQPLTELMPNEIEYNARFTGNSTMNFLPQVADSTDEVIVETVRYRALGLYEPASVGPDCGIASEAVREVEIVPVDNAYVEVGGPDFSESASIITLRFDEPRAAAAVVEAARVALDACLAAAPLYPGLEYLAGNNVASSAVVSWLTTGYNTPEVTILASQGDILIIGVSDGAALALEQVVQLVSDTLLLRAAGEVPLGTESKEWCALVERFDADLYAMEGPDPDYPYDEALAFENVGIAAPLFADAAYDERTEEYAAAVIEDVEALAEAGASNIEQLQDNLRSSAISLRYGCPTTLLS